VAESGNLAVTWTPSGLIPPRRAPFVPPQWAERTGRTGERFEVRDQMLVLDRWNSAGQMDPPQGGPRILHRGPAPVVIRDCQMGSGLVYQAEEGAGPVLIDCAYSVNGVWKFAPGQTVYAQSLNAEKARAEGPPFVIESRGAHLWLFGSKHEGPEGDILCEGGTLDYAGVHKRNVPAGAVPSFRLSGGCKASIRCVYVTEAADRLPAVAVERDGAPAVRLGDANVTRRRGAGWVLEWSST
jgi:hypothetical protein